MDLEVIDVLHPYQPRTLWWVALAALLVGTVTIALAIWAGATRGWLLLGVSVLCVSPCAALMTTWRSWRRLWIISAFIVAVSLILLIGGLVWTVVRLVREGRAGEDIVFELSFFPVLLIVWLCYKHGGTNWIMSILAESRARLPWPPMPPPEQVGVPCPIDPAPPSLSARANAPQSDADA